MNYFLVLSENKNGFSGWYVLLYDTVISRKNYLIEEYVSYFSLNLFNTISSQDCVMTQAATIM